LNVTLLGITAKDGLEDTACVLEPMAAEGGGGTAYEEQLDFLSEIVRKLNEIYGANMTEEYRLDLSNVRNRAFSLWLNSTNSQ
jgi:hypothetical protein